MENDKPRILIIENSKKVTGAFKSILLHTTYLRKEFDFQWIIPKKSKIKQDLIDKNFKVFEIPFIEISRSYLLFWYLPQLVLNAIRILKISSKEGIDIIHVNDIYNMVGVLIKWINNSKKIFYHVRLLPDSYIGRFFFVFRYFITRNSDEIITVSTAVSKHFDKHQLLIFDSANVDIKSSANDSIRSGVINIVYVGAIMTGKGQDMAIEAFAKASAKNNELRLSFIGSFDSQEPYYKSLLEKINQYDLSDKVSFLGFKGEPYQLTFPVDMALNFSQSESFSLTCLEASLVGIPVIVTDSGGPRDIVINKKTGFLISNGDVKTAAEKMLCLAENNSLRKSMGEAGKKFATVKFKIETQASKLSETYKKHLTAQA
ncbi:MAG: glycosyltransferase [Cyclobacteriaceae bacterium]